MRKTAMFRKSLFLLLAVAAVAFLAVGGFACSTNTPDLTFISSVTNGHDHSVTISGTDIDNPPSDNKTIQTTEGGAIAHFHTITLTKGDYQTLKDDGAVAVTTSVTNDHTHVFDLQKGNEVSTSGSSGY